MCLVIQIRFWAVISGICAKQNFGLKSEGETSQTTTNEIKRKTVKKKHPTIQTQYKTRSWPILILHKKG